MMTEYSITYSSQHQDQGILNTVECWNKLGWIDFRGVKNAEIMCLLVLPQQGLTKSNYAEKTKFQDGQNISSGMSDAGNFDWIYVSTLSRGWQLRTCPWRWSHTRESWSQSRNRCWHSPPEIHFWVRPRLCTHFRCWHLKHWFWILYFVESWKWQQIFGFWNIWTNICSFFKENCI